MSYTSHQLGSTNRRLRQDPLGMDRRTGGQERQHVDALERMPRRRAGEVDERLGEVAVPATASKVTPTGRCPSQRATNGRSSDSTYGLPFPSSLCSPHIMPLSEVKTIIVFDSSPVSLRVFTTLPTTRSRSTKVESSRRFSLSILAWAFVPSSGGSFLNVIRLVAHIGFVVPAPAVRIAIERMPVPWYGIAGMRRVGREVHEERIVSRR